MTVIWLSVKDIICRFFWGPIHIDASSGMQVEANDCCVSIPRKSKVILPGILSTLGESPLRYVGLYMSKLFTTY